MRSLLSLMAFSLLFCAPTATAGYRVFKLKIEHYDASGKKLPTDQTVLSHLDPNQYYNYHAGYGMMKVKMVDHWYCPGDTSWFREYCKRPKKRKKKKDAALPFPGSMKDPKRSMPRR